MVATRRMRGGAGWAVLVAVLACSDPAAEEPPGGQGDGGALDTAWDASAQSADGAAADVDADASLEPDSGADGGSLASGVVPWTQASAWQPKGGLACPVPEASPDTFLELLKAIGLDRSAGIPKALFINAGGYLADDPQRLDHFHTVQADMDGRGPCWTGNIVAGVDLAVDSDHPMTALLAEAVAALGMTLEVGGLFVLPHPDQPLVEALRALHIQEGKPFDEAAVTEAAKAVPMAVQRVAARILLGALAAVPWRDGFLYASGAPSRFKTWFDKGSGLWVPVKGGAVDPGNPADAGIFELDKGYDQLFNGGGRLLQALDEADLNSAKHAGDFEFATQTPWGRVVLRGGGDDIWDEDQPVLQGDLLLVLDTGGDDTWFIRAGANSSVANPVSVLVDLGGDDLYTYHEMKGVTVAEGRMPPDADGTVMGQGRDWLKPQSFSNINRQGSGRLGYGVLVDLGAGKDVYRSPRMSQGHALFGVGLLYDDGGDDHYLGEKAVQGAAFGGVALLHDGGGDDTYRAFHSSQGFGWLSSMGLLYDRGGHDGYECVVDDVLVYASPQTPKNANGSLCQGTAFGMRRPEGNNDHRSGGIALLRDRGGDDTYVGSTFVQGTGYWFGTGILADGAGDDTYDALFYGQGAAAHFALGFFLEGGGNDRYNQVLKPIHSVLGLGHDFSSSLFIDEAGDDKYRGASRAIGAAKCHGHGIFVDNGGDDSYEALEDKSIGWATDYDGKPGTCGNYTNVQSLGFFVDIGGTDTYSKPDASGYGDDKIWVTDDPDDSDALEYSGGIDAASGESAMHVAAPPTETP